MSDRGLFRLVEDPLGADALERPTREAVDAMWAEALKIPVPDYGTLALQRLRPRQQQSGRA